MVSFESLGLKEEIIRAVQDMGFENPMPIQEKVIPLFLKKRSDMIGLAQTGTGKTGAYGLPLLQYADPASKDPKGIILSPTRELCMQITKDLQNYAKYLPGIHIVAVYGGESIDKQIRALKKGAQIICATPGRMVDLINRKVVKLSSIDILVLDEADEMLNIGFREELSEILEQIPKERNTLLFSATMSEEIAKIAANYMNDPIEVIIGKRNIGAEMVNYVYYLVNARDRYPALKRIADINPDIYAIIFCRTRLETKDIAEMLIKDGYNADALHGDLSQAQRDTVMRRFRSKNLQMLVATDVAARGLDVNDLTHVINYNLPDDLEVFTHRSGRTGRAGKAGIAIAIIHSKEKYKLRQIEKVTDKTFERHNVPSGKDICEKQLFSLIDKMENVKVNESQIKEFLPRIYAKLEILSREELIKQFVSLEFNRFLEYYKNAPDLNVYDTGLDKKSARGRREKGEYDSGQNTRFFINAGAKDGLNPSQLITLLNQRGKNRDVKIGKIDVMKKFSFFETPAQFKEKVLESFQKVTFQGRKLVIEIAEPMEPRETPKRKRRKSRD